jgi:hypothetical protein
VPSKSLDGISGKVPAKRFHGISEKCQQKDSTASPKSASKNLPRHRPKVLAKLLTGTN